MFTQNSTGKGQTSENLIRKGKDTKGQEIIMAGKQTKQKSKINRKSAKKGIYHLYLTS